MDIVNNFEEFEGKQVKSINRRKLFPWWIKFFIWMFMIFGLIVPVAIILGVLGMSAELSLYGIETSQPLSLTGVFLMNLFIFSRTINIPES